MRKKIPLIGGIINLIESLKGDIGIIENTDVATHSISAGSYVIWHNELYKASSAIAVDDALSSSNLTAVSGGAANELNNKRVNLTAISGITIRSDPLVKSGSTVFGTIDLLKTSEWTAGNWINGVAQLNSDYPPTQRAFSAGSGSGHVGLLRINTDGSIDIYANGSNKFASFFCTLCYDPSNS